jgi:predicted protein tyrosine phosphatase
MASTPPLHILFVCRQNRRRSATAERVFSKDPSLEVRSAGTSAAALVQVNGRMLEWADVIFTMDGQQRRALEGRFPGHAAFERLICLEIPDHYPFLDPELVALLERRVQPHLERLRSRT